jgi:hypothetical protein
MFGGKAAVEKTTLVMAGDVGSAGVWKLERVEVWKWWGRVIEIDVFGISGDARIENRRRGLVDGGSRRYRTLSASWAG